LINSKINSLEKKFRTSQGCKHIIAGQATEDTKFGNDLKQTKEGNDANSDAAFAFEYSRKVGDIPFISIDSILRNDTNISVFEPLDTSHVLPENLTIEQPQEVGITRNCEKDMPFKLPSAQ